MRKTIYCMVLWHLHTLVRQRANTNKPSVSRKNTVLCILDSYFCKAKHQTNRNYKNSDILYGRLINAEFSLQSASHNSRKINQRQSWSQIREFWESFITYCCLRCYAQVISFHPYFYPFFGDWSIEISSQFACFNAAEACSQHLYCMFPRPLNQCFSLKRRLFC